MNNNLVSIITPCYNNSKYIDSCINSVVRQTFINWELIIVDDASTDNSVEIIQKFISKDNRIKIIKLAHNQGAAVARNIGIKSANGRYIAFLDSDDAWLSIKLDRQLCFMKSVKCSFSCTAFEKIDVTQNKFLGVGVPYRATYYDILKTNTIGCLTAIYDTSKVGKVYMADIRKRQDFTLWLRLLKKTDYVYGLNEVLAQYRVGHDSMTSNKFSAAKSTWRVYNNVEKLNFFKSVYYFLHYLFRGVLRESFPGLAGILYGLKRPSRKRNDERYL